jgi:hypothetical protein
MPNSLLRVFLFVLVLVSLAGSAHAFQRPMRAPSETPESPSVNQYPQQQIERATEVAQAKGTAAPAQRPAADVTKLARDADELSKLSQTVPGDIDQISKGVLPKDIDEKLKRIQKLAKELRSGISQ